MTAQVLAHWFAEYYVTEEQSGAALAVVLNAGGRLGPDLAFAVTLRLNKLPKPCPTKLRPWLLLALRDLRNQSRELFDYILASASWTEDADTALYLFIHLTEPRFYLLPGIFDSTRSEVGLQGDDYWLRESWAKVFRPHLSDAAIHLLPIVDQHLRRAHLKFVIAEGQEAAAWPSHGRTAIEPNASDQFPGPLEFLIDAARDCIETLLDTGSAQAFQQLDAWAASDMPLLRRLAIHGWAYRRDVSAAEKLAWLGSQAWLLDPFLNHEISRLLSAALPVTGVEDTDAFVHTVAAGADVDVHTITRAARLLLFTEKHSPTPTSANEALSVITAEHPELQEAKETDAQDDAPSPDEAPTTAEQFHKRLDEDPRAIAELLIGYESKRDRLDAPQWFLMAQLVSDTVTRWPDDGFALLDALGSGHPESTRATIYGWARTTFDREKAEAVLVRVNQMELAQVVDAVARMLVSRSTNWRSIPASRTIAIDCWNSLGAHAPGGLEGGDWIDRAVNHPAGLLTEYWILSIQNDWAAAPDAWKGLSPSLAGQLDSLLGSSDTRGQMAQVMLTDSIRFLHDADAAWCEHHVLPLLRWDDDSRARRAWGGFLSHGAWSNELLSAGLLTALIDTVSHYEDLEERRRIRLLQQLAGIAVYAEENPENWLPAFVQKATQNNRAKWAEQVAHELRTAPAELVEAQWHRWMRSYWEGRLSGRLMRMTTEEATAMAEWVVYLTGSQDEAVGFVLRHEAGLESPALTLRKLVQENRIARSPARIAELVAHLLRGTKSPFYAGFDLPNIIGQLKSHGVEEDLLRPIREEAARLHISLEDEPA